MSSLHREGAFCEGFKPIDSDDDSYSPQSQPPMDDPYWTRPRRHHEIELDSDDPIELNKAIVAHGGAGMSPCLLYRSGKEGIIDLTCNSPYSTELEIPNSLDGFVIEDEPPHEPDPAAAPPHPAPAPLVIAAEPHHPVVLAPETPPPPGAFRLSAKNIFLTWPHCDRPMQALLDAANARWPDKVQYAIACEEQHEDGIPHRHMLVCFKRKANLRVLAHLDGLAGQHGDYKAARDVHASIVYLKKDGHFVEYGVAPDAPENKISAKVARLVNEDHTMAEINAAYPHFVLLNKKRIDEYISLHQELVAAAAEPAKLPWALIPHLPDHDFMWPASWPVVVDWLNGNLGVERVHRQKQLYIWGGTALGKTLLVIWLERYWHIFRMPHSKWMEGFSPLKHQLAICDEFNGCYPISFINEFVQGTPMHLEVKGGMLFKSKNIPVIFLSNKPLHEWYRSDNDPAVKAALLDRWTEVEITERAPFFTPFAP